MRAAGLRCQFTKYFLSEVQEQSEVNRVFWRRTKHGQHSVRLFRCMYHCLLCTTLALCSESMVFIGIYTCLLPVVEEVYSAFPISSLTLSTSACPLLQLECLASPSSVQSSLGICGRVGQDHHGYQNPRMLRSLI